MKTTCNTPSVSPIFAEPLGRWISPMADTIIPTMESNAPTVPAPITIKPPPISVNARPMKSLLPELIVDAKTQTQRKITSPTPEITAPATPTALTWGWGEKFWFIDFIILPEVVRGAQSPDTTN